MQQPKKRNSLLAMCSGSLAVLLGNTAPQIVPDYRMRGALVWHF
jgi:hypothetical protein